jgi:hypothetical protein
MSISAIRSLVRPIITILFALGLIGGFFLNRVTADQFLPIAGAVLLWWFADRATNPRP